MVDSMNSIKFLFVVWAFLVLGGIARCKPPYPSEPRFSPRTLSFSTLGSTRDLTVPTDLRWTRSIRILLGLPEHLRGLPKRTGSVVVVAGNEFNARPTGSIFWRDRLGKRQRLAPSPWVLRGKWLGAEPTLRFPTRRYDAERRTTKGHFRVKTPKGQIESGETWKEKAWHI